MYEWLHLTHSSGVAVVDGCREADTNGIGHGLSDSGYPLVEIASEATIVYSLCKFGGSTILTGNHRHVCRIAGSISNIIPEVNLAAVSDAVIARGSRTELWRYVCHGPP